MIDAGFVEEVRALLQAGYSRDLPSMSGLGYRELAAHLLDDLPLDEAIQQAKFATHDYIRRQLTWFRGHDSGIRWQDAASFPGETRRSRFYRLIDCANISTSRQDALGN